MRPGDDESAADPNIAFCSKVLYSDDPPHRLTRLNPKDVSQ
jgi:hypothetical protein